MNEIEWVVFINAFYKHDVQIARFTNEGDAKVFADKLCCGYRIIKR